MYRTGVGEGGDGGVGAQSLLKFRRLIYCGPGLLILKDE